MSYARTLEKNISNGIGWISLFRRLGLLNDAIALIGSTKKVCCPMPHRHRSTSEGGSGGHDKFRLFADFDKTGSAVCTCAPNGAWVGLDLLSNMGVGDNFSHLLRIVTDAIENKGVDITINTPEKCSRPKLQDENDPKKVAFRRKLLNEVREGKMAISEETSCLPAMRYLANRGISVDFVPHHVYFHPSMYFKDTDDEVARKTGALVGLLTSPNEKPVTFHRTFITDDGEKASSDPKLSRKCMPTAIKSDGSISGSAIRLKKVDSSRVLNITEGIEKGFALAMLIEDESIWVGYSNTQLENIEINPDRYDHVRIWADHDPMSEDGQKGGAGIKSAFKLSRKLADLGIGYHVHIPDPAVTKRKDDKVDWEDVIVEHQLQTVPLYELPKKIGDSQITKASFDALSSLLSPLLFEDGYQACYSISS